MFRFITLFVAAAIAFTFLSCEDELTQPQNNFTLTGKLIDKQNVGIANALVEALNASNRLLIANTNTDEEGNFTLAKLPENLESVVLKFTHSDFLPFEQNLKSYVEQSKNGSQPTILTNQDTCCGKIIINVKNEEGEAINEAEIKLSRSSTVIRKSKTNSDGKLVFENICEGEYWLRIAKSGYDVKEEDINLEECDTVEYNVTLSSNQTEDTCCNNIVKIIPKDKQSGSVLNGAKVKIWKNGSALTYKEVENGSAIFYELCKGTYGVSIHYENYGVIEFQFEVDCLDTLEYVKELQKNTQDTCCNNSIKVFVKDKSSGESLNGAKVKLRKGSTFIAEKTVENGYVKFEEVCKGDYNLLIYNSNYKSIEMTVSVDCNSTKELEAKMESNSSQDTCCNNTAKIFVKDKTTGESLNGAKVKLRKGNTVVAEKTVENGYVKFLELCKGEYNLLIYHNDYKSMELSFYVECGNNKELDAKLEKESSQDTCCNNTVKVIVKDKTTGEIIKSANVKLRQNGNVKALKSTADGYAKFQEVCKGSYDLLVYAENYTATEVEFSVDCQETKEVVVQISKNSTSDTCQTAKLKLQVKDASDASFISGATVKIYKGNDMIAEGTTNSEGWFLKEGLTAPATYVVVITKSGYVAKEFQVQFKECNLIAEGIKLTRQ